MCVFHPATCVCSLRWVVLLVSARYWVPYWLWLFSFCPHHRCLKSWNATVDVYGGLWTSGTHRLSVHPLLLLIYFGLLSFPFELTLHFLVPSRFFHPPLAVILYPPLFFQKYSQSVYNGTHIWISVYRSVSGQSRSFDQQLWPLDNQRSNKCQLSHN